MGFAQHVEAKPAYEAELLRGPRVSLFGTDSLSD